MLTFFIFDSACVNRSHHHFLTEVLMIIDNKETCTEETQVFYHHVCCGKKRRLDTELTKKSCLQFRSIKMAIVVKKSTYLDKTHLNKIEI